MDLFPITDPTNTVVTSAMTVALDSTVSIGCSDITET
jgi:hypothetical protein